MKNSGNANADIERALDYLRAVARMEKRFQSRSQYRRRLQAMTGGEAGRQRDGSGGRLRDGSVGTGRLRDGSVSPGFERKGDAELSPVSQVDEPSPVSLLRESLAELDQELGKDLVHLQAVREQTWELFSRLSHPKAGQLLEEFYLNGTSIRVIAARIAYNERYIYRIKNQALRELGKLLRDKGIEDPL